MKNQSQDNADSPAESKPHYTMKNEIGSDEPNVNEKAVPVAETTEHGVAQPEVNQCEIILPPEDAGGKTEAAAPDSGEVSGPAAMASPGGIRALILAARKDPDKVTPLLTAKKEVVEVLVHKTPPKHLFWRARTDAEPLYFDLLQLRGDGMSEAFYLIASDELARELKENQYFTKFVHSYRLVLIIDPKGSYAWWPVRCDSESSWHESAQEIAMRLESAWGRVQAGHQKYDFLPSGDDLGEPDWPKEDDLGLLEKAFKTRLITSMDHPVLNELRGKKL